ncbi:MAG: hypothetical protein K6T90_21645 [Leptolyngbyaceae cyanobacterium HOT.MB2.61]|jgi:hypothetical protein|nr:hypothetical protein [Leptolyngbyaceae cyanobacterium HOT.MB2.61]
MKNPIELADLKIGDRVRLVRGMQRGLKATISVVNGDGSYCLIGDWTRQTGFVRVNYGPVERDCLEKLAD